MSATQEIKAGQEPDYARLLRDNLERVFNQRDPALRMAALDELFVAEPVLYEPDNLVIGRAAISAVVGNLLKQFPPTFRFTPSAEAVGHHGLAALRWQAGPADGPVLVTGTDVAELNGTRIARLWVLLDPETPES
ncbi:nuclear transport factor 2 family protein [Geminicoccus roseus]|uniref:nuclear transport factor 2 family protein n=1 Tax=Geminicoccus roseus TaxID=404900 RepID=UPI0004255C64|nr:nuclear transport factor 2 family protein [Geminicoccus roseus]